LSAIGVSILALALAGERAALLLRYDRAGLEHLELWRLVTAHLVHLDFAHAALNVAGLGLVWALFCGDYAPRQWLTILAAALVLIDAGLWFLEPQLAWYVGLSGVLHGFMGAGTWAHLRRGDWDRWILLAFLGGKLAWEQTQGALPLGPLHGHMTVVVSAHLYGALGGVFAALWLQPKPRPL
jgi:rhomboid family GlyGly-CTERM serine protease